MKKILALLLVLVCMATVATPAMATTNIIASGDCGKNGDNVKWTLSEDGVLTIYGEGEMVDFPRGAPWFDYGYPSTVIFGEGVTSVGENAFRLFWTSNPHLKNVEIASTVTRIGRSAFNGCDELREIKLPEALTVLERNVFEKCYKLESVNLPDGITSIEICCFGDCESLKSISIPGGVKSIGTAAFGNCKSWLRCQNLK